MKKCMGCFFPQKFYCKFLFCKKVKQKYYKDIDRFRAKIQGDSDMGLVCLPWCSDLNGSDFLNTNNTKIYISTNPISVMATTRCIKSFTCYTDVTLITFASIHTYHNSGAYLGVRSYFQASISISWERERLGKNVASLISSFIVSGWSRVGWHNKRKCWNYFQRNASLFSHFVDFNPECFKRENESFSNSLACSFFGLPWRMGWYSCCR